jgi:hypothetical protein
MSRRNTVNIANSTVNNSAVAGRDAMNSVDSSRRIEDLQALRAALAEATEEITTRGGTPEKCTDIEHELRKMGQEVESEKPDAEAVRFRWKSVLAILDGAVAAGTRINQISELVHRLFGG